jgi:hypothetical protein
MKLSNTRVRRALAAAGLVLLLAVLIVPTVSAYEGRGGDVVIIGADEVIDDDLYVGAGEFVLEGTIKGDLYAVGSTIKVNGTVEGDVVAAGQSVEIHGTVEDDARIAGYALVVSGEVADDLLGGAFSLEKEAGSVVGGDLLFGGYQALLGGDVGESVEIGAAAVRIAGSIGEDVTLDFGSSDPDQPIPPGFPFFTPPDVPPIPSVPVGLTIDEGASIGGDLTYKAIAEVDVPSDVVAGDIDFDRYVPTEVEAERGVKARTPAMLLGRWVLRQVQRFITLLLVGVVMMWLVPTWTRKLASIVETKPLPSLGWGVVAIAAFLFAMLVLFIATGIVVVVFGIVTLGGLAGRLFGLGALTMGSLSFGFNVIWSYVTKVVISLLLGQLIFRLFKSPAEENRWWPVILGVVIFVIITAIPVLGWLARLATVLLGLGAVWIWGREWLEVRRASAAPAESEPAEVVPAE